MAPKSNGGLAVPDLLKYFWSVQLRRIPAWSSLPAYTRWMEIEKLWLAPIYPNSLLWSTSHVKIDGPLLGPMLLTRDVWKTCAVIYGLMPEHSSMTSFLFHPLIPDSLSGPQMRPWFEKGIFRYADIVDAHSKQILSFDALREKYNLPLRSYYSYLQSDTS